MSGERILSGLRFQLCSAGPEEPRDFLSTQVLFRIRKQPITAMQAIRAPKPGVWLGVGVGETGTRIPATWLVVPAVTVTFCTSGTNPSFTKVRLWVPGIIPLNVPGDIPIKELSR